MKADVAHRQCSLDKMVKLVNSPKFAEELSFGPIIFALGFTDTFYDELLC